MKIQDIPLHILEHFSVSERYKYMNLRPPEWRITIKLLKCIDDSKNKHLLKEEWYYGWEDTSCSDRFNFRDEYPIYKVYHSFGSYHSFFKYKRNKFIVLDSITLSNDDIYKEIKRRNEKHYINNKTH